MNPIQEAKQELEASIRYAETAISKANQTIESMATYQEQTGREQALENQLNAANANVQFHLDREAGFLDQIKDLERELQRQQDLGQGYYDSMMTFKQQLEEAKTNMALMTDENERLKREKEASSGPCGCQAYRDLEERADSLGATVQRLKDDSRLDKVCAPTMPVIPKAVAIAIFRRGVACGVSSACDELDNATDIEINETGYTGGFEVNFTKYLDLSDHLDLDWMRDKVGDYEEASVIEALKNLCADNKFECRIHGVDDEAKDSASA